MNLLSQIALLQAGGPGSGCHGDNCGRPKSPGGELSWKPKVLKREGLVQNRKTKRVTIPLQAPPRSQVKTVSHLSNGGIFTQLKTPTRGRPKGSGDSQGRPSTLKGTFKLETNNEKTTGWKGVATIWVAKKAGGDAGSGTTVIALRDLGKMTVTIMEMQTYKWAAIGNTNILKFRNFGQAAGVLKAKYGVSWRLPSKGLK